MSHYATECWDAEIECSYGWIECVVIADRSAYDVQAHADKSGVPLMAYQKFPEPREVDKLVITRVKKELGFAFKGDQKMVEALQAMGFESNSGNQWRGRVSCTSIGKRYARTDELGVPFAITVDSTTSVTVRERDSKQQIRVNVDVVATLVKDVSDGSSTWNDILQKYPTHS